jgi:hypothetical protein
MERSVPFGLTKQSLILDGAFHSVNNFVLYFEVFIVDWKRTSAIHEYDCFVVLREVHNEVYYCGDQIGVDNKKYVLYFCVYLREGSCI